MKQRFQSAELRLRGVVFFDPHDTHMVVVEIRSTSILGSEGFRTYSRYPKNPNMKGDGQVSSRFMLIGAWPLQNGCFGQQKKCISILRKANLFAGTF